MKEKKISTLISSVTHMYVCHPAGSFICPSLGTQILLPSILSVEN
jgi:hypothetical protein